MSQDQRLTQVEILVQQERYSEAERILKDILSQDPNDIIVLLMLSEVFIAQEAFDKAETSVNAAITIAPDFDRCYFTKSRIYFNKEEFSKAEEYLQQAISTNPFEADYFAFLSNIKLIQKKYQESLDLADKALAIEPENILGLNMRSAALVKLDKGEESFETIEGALREDPSNFFTHANYGWGLLENGEHKKALEHFKMSLQENPNFEYAQQGMLVALKANNPFYNAFLKYAFWIGNLTSKYQWGFIIGFYFLVRIIRNIARHNESLQPFLTPIIFGLAFIAFSTWVIDPISNLFLRFNPYGKLLLDRKEKISSNFVALSFALFVLGILLYFIFSSSIFLLLAAFGFVMMLPLSVMLNESKPANFLLFYTIILGMLGIGAITQAYLSQDFFNPLTITFFLGFFAFQWIANYLLIKENNY